MEYVKWEYHVFTIEQKPFLQEELNKLGEAGWELTTGLNGYSLKGAFKSKGELFDIENNSKILIFKRKKK